MPIQKVSTGARARQTGRARRLSAALRTSLLVSLASFVLLAPIGCGEDTTAPSEPAENASKAETAAAQESRAAEAATSSATRTASAKKKPAERAPRAAHERPMPNLAGPTLAGTRLSLSELLGSRIVFLFFNPEVKQAGAVFDAVSRVAESSGKHNFKIVGVAIGSQRASIDAFLAARPPSFPIIDDSSGAITRQLGLRTPLGIIGVDPEGYMAFGQGIPMDGEIGDQVEQALRENLRIATAHAARPGALLSHPPAPELGVSALSNGETLSTADLRGRAAVVIFFLHTCPHCHRALQALVPMIEAMDEARRPRLVAVSLRNDRAAVRRTLRELAVEAIDPYFDPGDKAAERWGVTGSVPVIYVLDDEGRIRHRTTGWEGKRDAGLVRMKLAKAAGVQVPMLLDPKGYSGNDVCGTCHEQEHATWEYTAHASAYDTLVAHGADRRTDCVGCHVVGYEEPGGWAFPARPAHLEDVGCETCHGRGGPHLSPTFVPESGYESVCQTCHNPTHSLGFEFASFEPRVNHARIATLSDAERAALLEGGGPQRELLPTTADYVGSDACQSCHAKEFETWAGGAHGNALASLEKQDKQSDPACLMCHTTAYGKPGGFPEGGVPSAHADLARVGCESCHGPGGDHIGETAARVGTILSLGDKCDSCVILKVCGTCHDQANDPGFEFHVEERIEAQRHGTVPSAATRAEDETAARGDEAARLGALIDHAARHLAGAADSS